uniref:Reverse transcriptase domain-containing protein n=1 Tax=Amphimedon queenslandica TaxID=400682 RepID=A0A1X7TZT7_AMPQE
MFSREMRTITFKAIYLDFKKAFDMVPHQELLYKLWLLSITGPHWKWFECYLTYRIHFTSIDGVQSSCLPLSTGVPQGSILGPLLFLIYINDFPSQLLSKVYMFPDDTKLFRVVSSFNDN